MFREPDKRKSKQMDKHLSRRADEYGVTEQCTCKASDGFLMWGGRTEMGGQRGSIHWKSDLPAPRSRDPITSHWVDLSVNMLTWKQCSVMV